MVQSTEMTTCFLQVLRVSKPTSPPYTKDFLIKGDNVQTVTTPNRTDSAVFIMPSYLMSHAPILSIQTACTSPSTFCSFPPVGMFGRGRMTHVEKALRLGSACPELELQEG